MLGEKRTLAGVKFYGSTLRASNRKSKFTATVKFSEKNADESDKTAKKWLRNSTLEDYNSPQKRQSKKPEIRHSRQKSNPKISSRHVIVFKYDMI